MKQQRGTPVWQVQWKKEEKQLKLGGKPVLKLELSWPEIQRGGRGGERINRYYRRVIRAWRERWEKRLYCCACLDWAARQEAGTGGRLWTARTEGRVTFQDEQMLSITMDAWEDCGDGRPIQVRTGDLWSLPQGRPVPKGDYWPGRKGRKALFALWEEQGESRRAQGDCFFDPDFRVRLHRALTWRRCARTQEGMEYYAPQGMLAVPVEGVVTFYAPLPEKKADKKSAPAASRRGRKKLGSAGGQQHG